MNEISSDAAVTEDPADWQPPPVLSIIIPVYNELQMIGRVLMEVAKALPEMLSCVARATSRSSVDDRRLCRARPP